MQLDSVANRAPADSGKNMPKESGIAQKAADASRILAAGSIAPGRHIMTSCNLVLAAHRDAEGDPEALAISSEGRCLTCGRLARMAQRQILEDWIE